MNIRLTNVTSLTSKKNGKKYIVYSLLCENEVIIKCFIEYNGEIENQLLSLMWEDVSDYIKFQLDRAANLYRPYINLK